MPVLVGRGGLSPHLELVEGKIVCDDLLLSHLLGDKHQAGTAEWKAMLPGASSPGASRHVAAGLHILPPGGRDQEVSPALRTLSEERKKSKGLYKDWRI